MNNRSFKPFNFREGMRVRIKNYQYGRRGWDFDTIIKKDENTGDLCFIRNDYYWHEEKLKYLYDNDIVVTPIGLFESEE